MNPRTLPKPTSHRHPMRVVTRRTGLSADVLRAWERRHDVVAPVRSAAGRRLYSDAEIERLRLLYAATLGGRTIGQVAALGDEELAELARGDAHAAPPAEPADAIGPRLDPLFDACVHAVAQLDAFALDALLRRAAVALPADVYLDALVVPLLERVGAAAPAAGMRSVHRHVALPVLRRALERLAEAAGSPLAEPNAVVGALPGEAEELGALVGAAVAAAEGWRVTYLGAGVPAHDVVEVAVHTRARVVVLGVAHRAGSGPGRAEVRQMAALLPRDLRVVASAATGSAGANTGAAVPAGNLAALRAELRALARAERGS